MCGIAGIVAFDGGERPTSRQLSEMCKTLTHRGPDDEGQFVDGEVGLGMQRLAIIDLDSGQQPIFNEDRSVCTVFNGEIYNFLELRRELEASGHRFASHTDGEVIVHLWEEHGPDFVSRLNGMFAIAVWDQAERRLALIRDRVGIKPLFWIHTGRHLVYASEIKALLASGLVPREVDLDSLGQFLSWEYVPAPRTLFKGVHKLEPGTMLLVDLTDGSSRSISWWDVPPAAVPDYGATATHTRSNADYEEAVDQTLRQCVQRQLVSDVPLGTFLSGGVDSSLVVSGMGEARAFSIGFEDRSYDESSWARRVARHLGISHRVEILQPAVGDLFDKLMHFMDDPIGDFSIFPTYLVSRLAREEVTVALTGDGGDELFGGYETYVAQEAARWWSRALTPLGQRLLEPWIRGWRPRTAKKGWINKARRFVEGLEHDPRLGHARWRLFAGEGMRQRLFTPEAREQMVTPVGAHILQLQEAARDRHPIDRGLYVDLKSYLADNCLVKVDRMSMACSLEARVPLLDHELVELAFALPPRLKVQGRQTKPLLKKVAARHVPRECVYRPKEGFSIPIKEWLRRELRPLMEELLDPGQLQREGVFAVETIATLKREHEEGIANHSHILWSLMVFEDWRRRWRAT
ncbi:MAG: asparagine synthase (glutamine-hydrolyzing) [Thermoanaerobaculia bacterium]